MGAGMVFAEGDILEPEHTDGAGVVWPAGIDALLFSDYSFDHDYKELDEGDEESVKLLLMTAMKLPKSKKSSADKVGDLVRKTRNLPWKKVRLPLN